jgi:hypothetical protein
LKRGFLTIETLLFLYVLHEMERDYPTQFKSHGYYRPGFKGNLLLQKKRDRSDASITSNYQYLPLCVVLADEEAGGGSKVGVVMLL